MTITGKERGPSYRLHLHVAFSIIQGNSYEQRDR